MRRRRAGWWSWLVVLVAALSAPAGFAGEGAEGAEEGRLRLEVRVTAVTGHEVYLDVGRDQGLEPGDRVRLAPPAASQVEARVISVSWTSARARLDLGAQAVPVGTPGEVWIPAGRRTSQGEGAQDGAAAQQAPSQTAQGAGGAAQQGPIVPAPEPAPLEPAQELQEPPSWSAPPEEWSTDMPLLAEAPSPAAAQSEVELRGFVFASLDQTFDEGSDYTLARSGVDLEVENLFGRGGLLQLDVEAFARAASLTDQSDDDESRVRVDRFSYLSGGVREDPSSWEVGRFLQRMMPELGVLDGTEWIWRTPSGDRLGASVGFLPEPSAEMSTGDDLQVAGSWRHYAGADDELALGLGVQKTWHEGEADRDLVVGTLDWRPDPDLSLHGSTWLDWYDSGEAVKSSGLEVTQANLNVTKRFSTKSGGSLFATHLRFPDLSRNEFPVVSAQELEDFENTRFGLSAWREIARKTRLSGRVDYWMDDEDDGTSGELRLGVRDRILSHGELACALFAADGKYSSVAGLRLTASRSAGEGWWTLGWESGLYQQNGFVGDQEELWQHVLRGSYDLSLGSRWDLSLWGDQRFGDEQEATSLGVLLRRRF